MDALEIKLLLKIQDKNDEGVVVGSKWVHFCYVDTKLYTKFLTIIDSEEELNGILSAWCKEDFGVDLSMATSEDLQTLRDLIKEHYKNKYPEVYRDSSTDRQGWTRIWVTENMRKVVQNSGK